MDIEVLYRVTHDERQLWGDKWTGVEKFRHAEETLIAVFPKTHPNGQDVEVYCSALPARFYKLKALHGTDSLGSPKAGFVLATGSGTGMAELTKLMAEAISRNMLGLV